jgi:hydrogenase small subunit
MSRREFLKLAAVVGTGAAVNLTVVEKALAGNGDPRVIWLQGQSCSGCSVSLLNSINMMTVDELLLDTINLEYHSTLIAAAGDLAFSRSRGLHPSPTELSAFGSEWLQIGNDLDFDLDGNGVVDLIDFAKLAAQGYVLVVEGSIPEGSDGRFCHVGGEMTMSEAFDKFSNKATHILAIGSCATYGGIPGASPNPTGAVGVQQALDYLGRSRPLVNIPGCPAHPDWFVGTLSFLLANSNLPVLDSYNRPVDYFPATVHTNCPLKSRKIPRAVTLGQYGCLEELGCKGKITSADCPQRKWNSGGPGQSGVNWCIGARNPCHGCTEPGFPDSMTPFYTL